MIKMLIHDDWVTAVPPWLNGNQTQWPTLQVSSEDHHIYWSESMKPTDEWNKPDNPTQMKLIFHDDHYPVAEC